MQSEEYKSIECISNMSEEYKENFFAIVDEYRNELSERLLLDESVYTSHDFDHHCFDVYKIISEIILENDLGYSYPFGIYPRELYILNLAVLFHDIGMFVVGGTREDHSVQSAEYVQREFDNTSSVFSNHCNLSSNEIKALKEIIKAHSDVKDGTVSPEQNGLKSPFLKDYPMKTGGKLFVRTKFLAAILRVADELDVTSDRLGKRRMESEIENSQKKIEYYNKVGNQEKAQKWEKYLQSLGHWKRLHYISHITREDRTIVLHIDDEEICKAQQELSIESLADVLYQIKRTIVHRIDDANSEVFEKSPFSRLVSINDVIYETVNTELQHALNVRSV